MSGMVILYAATAIALAASALASRAKTAAAVKLAVVRLGRVLPAFLFMLVLLAVAVTLAPRELISRLLGQGSGALGVGIAAAIGSVTLMPGFIAFPLAGALRQQGVPYMVLAAFTTTLMMVGVLTFPLESRYFGRGVALVRNVIGLLIALAAALAIGLVFGEIRP